jgi:hypothetical protein
MDEQLEFVKQIAERLATAGIEYMMTGSMAMAIYASPRMTRDVDVVVDRNGSGLAVSRGLVHPTWHRQDAARGSGE